MKFRWYPKKDYIGIRPCEEGFGSGEEPWLLGCIISEDGAADLVCAVPKNGLTQTQSSVSDMDDELDFGWNDVVPIPSNKGNKSSLDSMIAQASKKRT